MKVVPVVGYALFGPIGLAGAIIIAASAAFLTVRLTRRGDIDP